MKGFYRLLNIEFANLFAAAGLISVAALLLPQYFIRSQMKDVHAHAVHERFELVYASSGSITLFVVLFAAMCLWFIKSFYARYWGSKSMYTLLTLPVKREAIYFSQLIAFVICLLILLAAQLISIFWAYHTVVARIEGYHEGQYVMANGLFLAFIRSGFLSLLLPLTWVGVISSLSLFTASAVAVLYGVICERSKRYWGFAVLALAVYLLVKIIGRRLSDPVSNLYHSISTLPLYGLSLLLFAVSGFMIWHSLRLINKGAIAS